MKSSESGTATERRWPRVALGLVGFLVLTAAATGLSTSQARTAAPAGLNLSGAAASEGTAASFARSDHVHALSGILSEVFGGTNKSSYTKGDLLVASGTTTLTKLAVGSNAQVLTADSTQATGMKWTAAGSVNGITVDSPLSGDGTSGSHVTLSNQSANTLLAGPASGGAAASTFRAMVEADLPLLRTATDGSDLAVWLLSDSASPWVNTGSQTLTLSNTTGTVKANRVGGVLGSRIVDFASGSGIYSAGDSSIEPTAAFTVSCWVRLRNLTSAVGAATTLVAKGYRPGVGATPIYSIALQVDNTTGLASITYRKSGAYVTTAVNNNERLGVNQWAHIGGTWDGTTLSAYLNGQLVGTVASAIAIDYGTHGPWEVGGEWINTSETNAGASFQDVRVASVARAASWFESTWKTAMRLP